MARHRRAAIAVVLFCGACGRPSLAASPSNGGQNPLPPPPPDPSSNQQFATDADPWKGAEYRDQPPNYYDTEHYSAAGGNEWDGGRYYEEDRWNPPLSSPQDIHRPPPGRFPDASWVDAGTGTATDTGIPQYQPIHYNFPKEKEASRGGFFGRRRTKKLHEMPIEPGKPILDELGIPDTILPPVEEVDPSVGRDPEEPEFASARRDVITRYQSTAKGKLNLAIGSGVAGSMVGAFLGKSLLNKPLPMATAMFLVFLLCTLLRNPYGELVRAMGMALILALQRTTSIRSRYPTWRHVKASLGADRRRPFPPSPNPWNYQPRDDRDPEFKMLFATIAIAFVGSTCGGSLPLIPTWLGSLAGAGFFGWQATSQNARGDLVRTMGMRVVALCEEMLGINKELEILRKGAVVTGKVLDKVFILDSKHRIKDRLIAGASFLFSQASAQVLRVQNDMNRDDRGRDNKSGDTRNDGARRDDRDRSYDRDRRPDPSAGDDYPRSRPEPRDRFDLQRRPEPRGDRRPPDNFRRGADREQDVRWREHDDRRPAMDRSIQDDRAFR